MHVWLHMLLVCLSVCGWRIAIVYSMTGLLRKQNFYNWALVSPLVHAYVSPLTQAQWCFCIQYLYQMRRESDSVFILPLLPVAFVDSDIEIRREQYIIDKTASILLSFLHQFLFEEKQEGAEPLLHIPIMTQALALWHCAMISKIVSLYFNFKKNVCYYSWHGEFEQTLMTHFLCREACAAVHGATH